MSRAAPLPRHLASRPFHVSTAAAAGVSRSRLRAMDLSSPYRAVRVSGEPSLMVELCGAYAQRMPPTHVFCGPTAAVLLGIPLPFHLERDVRLHVAAPSPGRAPRSAGIIGHKLTLRPLDTITRSGLRLTSPQRTWLDLAQVLPFLDLVAAGDFLIRRRHPLTTVEELATALQEYPGRRGLPNARDALPYLSDRAESPPESKGRVVFIRAGIRGLEVNFPVQLVDGPSYRLDFAIPALKIAIEYQGDYHRDPAQWRRDMTRISRLRAQGWIVIEINADDLRDPAELVTRIRSVIAERTADRVRGRVW